jgi:hypothetical protein
MGGLFYLGIGAPVSGSGIWQVNFETCRAVPGALVLQLGLFK